MKITLLWVGKTRLHYWKEGIQEYQKRIQKYQPFSVIEVPDVRKAGSLPRETLKQLEGEKILNSLVPGDELWLFDEKGKMFSSLEFSGFLEKKMLSGSRNLVFAIGGAYGFSPEVYARSQGSVSLSVMTFSHQMVRVIAAEQIYRALAILRGDPYHHE